MGERVEVALQKKYVDSKLGIQFINRNDAVFVYAAISPEVKRVVTPSMRVYEVNGIPAHSALQVATVIRDAHPGDITIVVDKKHHGGIAKESANTNRRLNTVSSKGAITRSRTKNMLSLKKTNKSVQSFFSSKFKSIRHIVRGNKNKRRTTDITLNKDGVLPFDKHIERYPDNSMELGDDVGNENPLSSKQGSFGSPKKDAMADSNYATFERSDKVHAMVDANGSESDDTCDSTSLLNRVSLNSPVISDGRRHSTLDRRAREALGYGLEEIEPAHYGSHQEQALLNGNDCEGDDTNDSTSPLNRVSFSRRHSSCDRAAREALGYGLEGKPAHYDGISRRAAFQQSMPRRSLMAQSFGCLPELQHKSSFMMQEPTKTMTGMDFVAMNEFVKGQRIKDWVKYFRRSDPRYQILHFFNDVAQVGTNNMDAFNPILISPLLRAFYKSSVFSVWRPTSFDAIRRMMLHEGVGKGLNIKGKSAKKGRLSGFVPYLQIHNEEHKKEIRTHSKDARIRVFYKKKDSRDTVVEKLKEVCTEMIDTLKRAEEIVNSDNEKECDDDTMEWALEKLIWAMTDPTVNHIDDYAPNQFGIDAPVRLFWEAIVQRQDISRAPGSEDDVGRPSEPNFQNMNNLSLRKDPTDGGPKTVLMHYLDPNDKDANPLNPLDFVMAYEENNRVMPVVSDFDCFLVGTRGVEYKEPIPDDQLEVLQWCVNQIEAVLENGEQDKSWTSTWLNVLKSAAAKGFHPKIPPLGFSDPKTGTIMKQAIHRLEGEGSVRHGAECFNFWFPQELDDEFLIISDDLPGTSLPWKYVDPKGLQDILKAKIDQGYAFPLHPKWVLCDDGWKSVYDQLMKSQKANVQDGLATWYPPESGIREKIESISKRFPSGFSKIINDDHDGTAAMDLAEQELRYYLTFQRAKRKLRGMLIWKRILDEHRQEAKAKAEARESAASSGEIEPAILDESNGEDETLQALTLES